MTNLSDLLVNYQSNETLDSVTSRGATTTNDLTIGNLTSTGDLTVDTNTLYVDSTSNKVGIGVSGTLTNTLNFPNAASIGFKDIGGNFRNALQFNASNELQIGAAGAGITAITLGPNGSEWVIVNSAGNVGIGATNLIGNLHVQQNTLSTNGIISLVGSNSAAPSCISQIQSGEDPAGNGSAFMSFHTRGPSGSFSAPTERMRIESDGDVRLGYYTSSGSANGLLDLTFVNTNSTEYNAISLKTDNVAGRCYINYARGSSSVRGDLIFGSSNTERMRISWNGNVGIGETNPTTGKLVVLNTDNDDYAIRIGNIAGASGSLVGITKIGLDTGTSSPTHPSAAIEVEQAAISGYQADLVFSTRKSNSDVAPTESLRIDSEGKVSNGTGTTKNYTYFPLPYFYMGASSITDEYLIISRYNDTGSAVVATGVDGEILFSRGNTGAGNAQEKVEISVQDAWTGTPRIIRFNTSDVRRFFRIDVITVDSQKYLALRAAQSGGGSTNHIFFRGIVTGESTDSKLLTRVRSSDSNVTVNTSGWMYPAGFEYRDDTTGGFLGIRAGGADVGRFDSDGLKFGTDSAAANALDDYEEGSFTADIRDGTSSVSIGTGYYTKVGNIVTCAINGYNQNISSLNTSHLRLGGLPFNASTNGVAIGRVSCSNFETAFVQVISGQNYGFMYGNLLSGPNVKSLVKTDFASQTGASLWITVTYRTA